MPVPVSGRGNLAGMGWGFRKGRQWDGKEEEVNFQIDML